MTSVQASVLHGAKDLRIETRHLPDPAPDEVQIQVRSTGLCGSDLHYYNHGRNGDITMQEPMSLGHESAGVVVAIGSDVSNLGVGDKVALEVGVPCGGCDRCNEGRYNLCKGMRFRSSAKSFPHFQGTLQSRINHPATWCHRLPDAVSLEMGAILEPLGVALHAARRAALPRDSTVLVFGAGAVGLLCAAMARYHGASSIIIADIDKGRVDFAVKNSFADLRYVVPATKGQSVDEDISIVQENAAAIGRLQGQSGSEVGQVDVTFDCTGVPSCVQTAIYATRAGGKVMLVGMSTPIYTLPVSAAALREVDLCGVFRYVNTYPEAIEIVVKKHKSMPDLSKLVTHRYNGFDNVEKAFHMAGRTKDQDGDLVLKVVIEVTDDQNSQA